MSESVIETRKTVDGLCHSFFSKSGYSSFPEEPLIPTSDTTISFTNSAIVPFKGLIESGKIPDTPFFIRQKCIRLRETASIPNPDYLMERMSCFHMYGSFASIVNLNKIIDDTLFLLVNVLRVDRKRLVFNVCSEDKVFYTRLLELGYSSNVIVDATPKEEYRWRYGMPGVIGRGINICILPDEHSKIKSVDDIDIGQIIIIEKDGIPTCLETSLGIETFTSRLLNLDSVFRCSEIAEIIPFSNNPYRLQLMDSVVLATEMCSAGVLLTEDKSLKKTGRQRSTSLKKAIKTIAEIQHLDEINGLVLDEYIRKFVSFKKLDNKIAEAIIAEKNKFLLEYKAKVGVLENYARICRDRRTRGEIDTPTLKHLINERGRKELIHGKDIERSRSPERFQ